MQGLKLEIIHLREFPVMIIVSEIPIYFLNICEDIHRMGKLSDQNINSFGFQILKIHMVHLLTWLDQIRNPVLQINLVVVKVHQKRVPTWLHCVKNDMNIATLTLPVEALPFENLLVQTHHFRIKVEVSCVWVSIVLTYRNVHLNVFLVAA